MTEILKPDTLVEAINERREELIKAYSIIHSELARVRQKGNIRFQKHGNSYQCFHITEKGDTKGKYIPKKNMELAVKIAQRNYNQNVLSEIERQIKELEKFIDSYSPQTLDSLYEKNIFPRKKLIKPVTLNQNDIIKNFKSLSYQKKSFSSDAPEYYTINGERVRSKSELIIANTLSQNKIPYHYELPLIINNRKIFPDFTCLNLRTHKIFIWEHFGMMDDMNYVSKTLKKLETYENNNYLIGKNLISTFETRSQTISTTKVQKQISQYLT